MLRVVAGAWTDGSRGFGSVTDRGVAGRCGGYAPWSKGCRC